jgi:hypothetical protein
MEVQMRAAGRWWSSPILWVVLAFVAIIPFFVVDVPPLTDLPNHIARYYIFLNIDKSAFLANYYDVHWHLIGNLGVDVIVRAIGPLLGAELAARAAVGTIPVLAVAGIYSVSRALNGEVAPSALVALPLVYNWPFISGFVNFSLAAALALLVFALWIRLRRWGFVARLFVFAPLSFATWVAHIAGWGLLGLAVAGFEMVRAYRLRGLHLSSLIGAAFATLPFALMIFFTFVWRSETSAPIGVYFASDLVLSKLVSLATILREQYRAWDVASTLLFLTFAIASYFAGGKKIVVAAMAVAVIFTLVFIICPDGLFAGQFADRRLLPYAAIFAVLSISISDQALADGRQRRWISPIAAGAIAFFAARVGVTTFVWERLNRSFDSHLELLAQVPLHSRIFALMVEPCEKSWPRERLDHLQQLAVPRRESVVNGLFQESGLNQVDARYRSQAGFDSNLTATVHDRSCPVPYIRETLQTAMAQFPRSRFDLVWLVTREPLPDFDRAGLLLIGSVGNDRLYKIVVP